MTDSADVELSLLRETIEFLPEAVAIFDAEDRFVRWNRKYAEFYAEGAQLLARGKRFEDYLREFMRINRFPGSVGREEDWVAERMARHRLASSSYEHEIGGGRWVRVEERRLTGGGSIGIRIDITEAKRREMQLAFLAHHDPLTGLANRTLLAERIEARVLSGDGGSAAVICLDLDRFKDVNDTLGHPVGDELLRRVAERLQDCVQPNDTISRLGGDEFTVLVSSVGDEDAAQAAADTLVRRLSEPYEVEGRRLVVGASAGIALMPLHGTDAVTLLRHADIALYRAKGGGRARAHLFEPVMNLRAQRRRILEEDLRTAVGTPAIEVHYQPVVQLESGRPYGFEALVRWRHATRGLVAPADFVGLAEETGLIDALGRQVLREGCRFASRRPDIRQIAVNLSAVQFRQPSLVDDVRQALTESGLEPWRLELEITESVLFEGSQNNIAALHALRDLGLSIALDDFGTGYSSLSHLRVFPFDRIKIDRSFTRDMMDRADCRSIVRAVLRLSESLGIAVTAEGIETEAQRQMLMADGCRYGQGYLFGRPMPLDPPAPAYGDAAASF